ncbi:MAG TPA: alpha/beta fold hydrolase [Gemmatimonadales bacterium]|nr:alpha/beta fold hydrolase [Gemmatimonadales bacterium]
MDSGRASRLPGVRRLPLETVVRILAGLAAAYGILVLLAWRYQEKLAFPAPRTRLRDPADAGMPDGRRVTVRAPDGVALHGWFLPAVPGEPDAPAPGLLWFYGNMETVSGLAPIIRDLRPPGVALLILDYRGYGESEGTPTEPGLYLDGEAAWTFITSQPGVDATRIAVYGRSLGAAVALHVASTRPVAAVVLDSPFSTGAEMAREHYPLLPAFIVRLSLDNVGRAARIRAPLLVFHGTDDAIAPLRMGRAVAQAGRARELVLIDGAGHNDTYDVGGRRYREKMHAFLQEALRREALR